MPVNTRRLKPFNQWPRYIDMATADIITADEIEEHFLANATRFELWKWLQQVLMIQHVPIAQGLLEHLNQLITVDHEVCRLDIIAIIMLELTPRERRVLDKTTLLIGKHQGDLMLKSLPTLDYWEQTFIVDFDNNKL